MEKPNNSVPASSELAGAATMGTPFMGTPYMGWNSYDYYCTEVNEEEVLANARVMADKLKPFGWEYVVNDFLLQKAEQALNRWQIRSMRWG